MREIDNKSFHLHFQYKLLSILCEIGFFFLTLLYGIRLISYSLTGIYLNLYDVWISADFYLFLFGLIGLICFPWVVKLIRKGILTLRNYINSKNFRDRFFADYRGVKVLDIEELTQKYNISMEEVDRFFEQAIQKDLLRGAFERQHGKRVFVVPSDFEILPIKERPLYNLDQNLIRYLEAYKSIAIEKLAIDFKVTIEQVEKAIDALIEDGYIVGVIKDGTFIKDLATLERNK
jgi:hypothetical protein